MIFLTRARWLLTTLGILLILLAPALWNGFPFVWADTGGYLARPFERTLELGRSALYGTFVAVGMPFDFWPTVIVQAAITWWVLALILRAHAGWSGRPWQALTLVLALALLTALPWFVGTLMPDIFVPLAVLALYLLAFCWSYLSRWEVAALIALTAVAIASHMAILGLGAALVVAFIGLWLLGPRLRLPPLTVAAPAAAVVAGITLALVSNFAIATRLAFTPGGAHFVFGRLLQDGIVARYLAERCPDATLRLCEYRDRLPTNTDDWLWGWDSPFYKLGGLDAYAPEARRVVADTLTMYPGMQIAAALRATLQQLMTFRTGDGINPHDTEHAVRALQRYAPQVMPRFIAARQQRDLFDFTWLNRIHVPVGFVALALLPVIIVAGYGGRIEPSGSALALTTLLALLANAAICGALSTPGDRYQNRIVWLAPLAVMVAAAQWRRAPARA